MNLMFTTRNRLSAFLLLIFGCLAGIFVADKITRWVRLSAGTTQLNTYVSRLAQREQGIDQQTDFIINTVHNDGVGFCSAEEMRVMRALVYRSRQVKDIGRTRDGLLYCSSELSILEKPVQVPIVNDPERKVFAWLPIMLIDRSGGMIVRTQSLSMVINPDVFALPGDERIHYGVFVFEDRLKRFVKGFGDNLTISDRELLASEAIRRDGKVFMSRCLKSSTLCLVAETSEEMMLAADSRLQVIIGAAGGLIGCLLAAGLLLLRAHHTSMLSRLRRAIARDELQLVYQPIVDLDSSLIVGAEALVRWKSTQGKQVPPDIFIPLAENNGLIRDITQLVIRRSLEEIGDLLRKEEFTLSINISAEDLCNPGFCSRLQDSLKAARVKSSQIGLELTERSTVTSSASKQTLRELQAVGHRVYIDDFGTGYSSLAYLSELRADTIKIDRAFTALVRTGSITETIIPQILEMANHLHLSVVVEGVETVDQADYFRSKSSNLQAQGWLFGRPVDARSLAELVNRSCDLHNVPNLLPISLCDARESTRELGLQATQ